MRVRVAGMGHQGTVPTRNDDHYCIGPFVEQTALTAMTIDVSSAQFQQYGLLAAVADGMGAYAGGAVASRMALETLSALFYGERRPRCTGDGLAEHLARYLEQTQQILAGMLQRTPEYADAGTTIAGVALMPPDAMVVFHAGDSRVLRVHGEYIRTLTLDHTPVSTDVATGRLSEEEAAAVPTAFHLTRALGLHGDSRAEVNKEHSWAPGNQLFIGTDGWHGLGRGLSRAAIRRMARAGIAAEVLVQQLVTEAVTTDGGDNATLIVVQLADDGWWDG